MLAPLTPQMAQQLLSPSARVLVAAAMPGTPTAGTLPWHEVHWPTLVSLMAYERAETQVCRLLRAEPDRVPEDVRSVAKGLDRVSRFRAAELSDAAASVVDALAAASVPVLWLKGAALAMQREEGFGVRGMGDLDLLVTPADADRARAALTGAGWMTPDASGYGGHHHEAPMRRPGGLRLELHTALFPANHPFADESAEAWLGRAREVMWGSRRVFVLPTPWHVLHASVHWAWSHEGTVGTWQYLHDMHRLTAGWRPDGAEWTAVGENAKRMGAAVPVGWAIWTAWRLSGLDCGDRVMNRLRGRLRLLDGVVERQWVLATFQSPAGSPSVRWSRFWWRRAMQGLGDVGERWPWRTGRGAVPSVRPGPGPAAADGGRSRWSRWSRWRRHLGRVLGT